MEKRTIFALILTAIIIFFFQMYFTPKEPQKAPAPPKTEVTRTEQDRQTPDKQQVGLITDKKKDKKKPVIEVKPPKDIQIETPLLSITMMDFGGGIKSVKLKKYKETVKDSKPKELIENIKPYIYIPRVTKVSGNETFDDRMNFKVDKTGLNIQDKPETITFTGMMADGSKVKKSYTFYPDTYTFDINIEVESQKTDKTQIDFAVISDKNGSSYTFKGPFIFNGKKFQQIEKIEKNIDVGKTYRYAGLDDGFFAFIWIPKEETAPELTILKTEKIPVIRISPDKATTSATLFFGPKQTDVLKSLNIKAEKIIDFGWFDVIAKPLVWGMNYSNKVTHNYGIDIILLTILIKIIFYPLSLKSYKSMKEMQKLQPQIQKLKEKYKDDKQKLNQEMMELYKRRKINPMGGCLPMVIQIPVFFALYKALSGAIELRHAHFLWWINDLSAPEDLFSFTVLGFTIPIRILPLIMGITQVIQQKMTPTSADPMQEKMMLFMPILFTFLFWGFPSGLVLYWLINNVISIGQQYYINKKVS
ncbi:MAG TPA: membrane protein insertase YidC [Syntrophorhabdaceae bacterium]|nr:membrane protein insertase YidC [Syntrophorhabdaceae bacterium]HOL06407.1 membrane protein insertase YidC [Syntrophorhabdaceae bacterium]HON86410.1 membrane protein insertase YidC [Syntrophorhabdaceae bacterium]HOT41383.1 membrane protein insertase YidC [Syntrophorhabdaceae bacterium]HPP42723.1 membrane protein insertase YidC [Syntrophorhabdaceae bacterium]